LSQEQRDRLEEAEWWVLYPEMVQCSDCKSSYFVEQGKNEDAEGWEEEI